MKPFLKEHPEGVLLFVKAQPRASRNEIGDVLGPEIKIKITAPPVDSAANRALIDFLAETLNCPKSAIQIIRGEPSRHKTFLLRGLALDEIEHRLSV